MITIVRATLKDKELLANLGKITFIEDHGHSAPQKLIDDYVIKKFSVSSFEEELNDDRNIFLILYFEEQAVGYSKIILNNQHVNIRDKNVTKLERLYILKAFHGLKLGLTLFNFNAQISIKNKQRGVWLFVWTENKKAIGFYEKLGFKIIGHHDFKISSTHYNPNYQMLLHFKNETYNAMNFTD